MDKFLEKNYDNVLLYSKIFSDILFNASYNTDFKYKNLFEKINL